MRSIGTSRSSDDFYFNLDLSTMVTPAMTTNMYFIYHYFQNNSHTWNLINVIVRTILYIVCLFMVHMTYFFINLTNFFELLE